MSVRIILTEPTHPGNIGAAARAMKNMALSSLYLVNPAQFPSTEATVRASGADELLANAVVVSSLKDAIAGCDTIFATSARRRGLEWPLCTPREAAEQISIQKEAEVAIIFGRESSGLTNEELMLAQTHIHIPTSANFSSLNLGAAVQVIAYELFQAEVGEGINKSVDKTESVASADELNGFFDHLRTTMIHANFLNPRQPKKLLGRLRRLFYRAALTKTEINILRGFLSAVDKLR